VKSLLDPLTYALWWRAALCALQLHEMRFNRLVPDRPPLHPGVRWAPIHRCKNCGYEVTGEPR
jgi:hypothetical protein